jgi:hypothetical protein
MAPATPAVVRGIQEEPLKIRRASPHVSGEGCVAGHDELGRVWRPAGGAGSRVRAWPGGDAAGPAGRLAFGGAPLTPLVHLHGLVFTGWIVLYFAQTVLIARHRTALHRRLGVAGAGLAVLLVLVGVTTTVQAIRRVAAGGPGLPLPWLTIPLGAISVFAILSTAGILYRRRPETHKRLMLLATISIIDAAVARWPLAIMQAGPVVWFAVTDLFVLAGAGYDLLSGSRNSSGLGLGWAAPGQLAAAPVAGRPDRCLGRIRRLARPVAPHREPPGPVRRRVASRARPGTGPGGGRGRLLPSPRRRLSFDLANRSGSRPARWSQTVKVFLLSGV